MDTGKADSTKTWEQNRQVKLKFTYKEQREFETIDDDIAALEEKVADLDAQILANATNAGKAQRADKAKGRGRGAAGGEARSLGLFK